MNNDKFVKSPPRKAMESVGEKPLSPVLAKKRFARRHINRKSISNRSEYQSSPNAKPYNKRNSCIPVPVKDYKDHSHQSCIVPSQQTDVHTTSSSSLTNFKQEVITKCAKSPKYLTKFESTAGNSAISISESKINRTYDSKFHTESKTESDSRMQKMIAKNKTSRYPQVLTQNIEVKCASGDISEDSADYEVLKDRSQFVGGQLRKNHLDMLYENTKFESAQFSKTTVSGSVDSDELAVKVFCNNNYQSTDSSGESVLKFANYPKSPKSPHTQCIKEEDTDKEQMSQPNYNGTTDESSGMQDVEMKEYRKRIDDEMSMESRKTSKNVINVNLSPSMKEQIRHWSQAHGEDKNPFFGFTPEEVLKTENEYEKYKANYKLITQKKKKKHEICDNAIAIEENPGKVIGCVSIREKSKEHSTVVVNGVKAERQDRDESISLTPNNRVQICIGHNRIKINIKADGTNIINTHDSPSISDTTDLKTSTDLPAISYDNEIADFGGLKTASGKPTKINHKKVAIAKEMYDGIKVDPSTDSDTKIKKVEPDSYDLTSSGFKSASSRKPESNQTKFDDVKVDFARASKTEKSIRKHVSSCSFQLASGNPSKINAAALKKAAKLFEDLDDDIGDIENISSPSDCIPRTSSKRSLFNENELNKQLISRGNNTVSSEFSEVQSEYEERKHVPLCDRKILKPKKLLQRQETSQETPGTSGKNVFQFGKVPNFNFDFTAGFSSAAGKHINIDMEKLKQASAKFEDDGGDDIQMTETNEIVEKPKRSEVCTKTTMTTMTTKFETPVKDSRGCTQSLTNSTNSDKTAHELIEDVVNSYDKVLERLDYKKRDMKERHNTTPVRTSISKKRIGMGKLTKFNMIPKEKLEKAKFLFDECDKNLSFAPHTKSFTNLAAVNTPVKVKPGNPLPVVTSTPRVDRNIEQTRDLEFTPIKTTHNVNKVSVEGNWFTKQANLCVENDDNEESTLVFHEKSCSNFKELQNDIDIEYMNLKRKLEILEERKKALENQKEVIDHCDTEHTRPRPGILTIRKKNSQSRVHLSELCNSTDDNLQFFNIDQRIHEITPRNSEKIHFNATKNDRSVISTLDGAIVIPNTRNTIGVTEIKNAFQAMSGINPQLIPKGWVTNHYKWIVWKLASYERKFPQYFKDCLSIENIIQQLKYRYDREIDRASRSAIRRIMEKDDVPNKRIVLCVADIIQICNNKFELLLTDGWYAIKTVIDALLCQQIYNNKLRIGTKLIIQGAELLDCDGCHPLEAPEHVKLKIGYNTTRRTIWHTRLGYYKNPFPYPIRLKTIHPDGGQVACIKVFIVRVYPVRFMEDFNGVKIWRNAKAEEKRAREFDTERMKELEKIKHQVFADYERDIRNKSKQRVDKQHLHTITCPKTLYQMIEVSNDPESLYNSLNPDQKSMVMDYKLNAASERQKEIAIKMSKQIEELKLSKRNVTPMLKLLVTDAMEESLKCLVLNIWRPNDEQMQMFREESCMHVYNVVMKKTNELNTVSRTMFKMNDTSTMKRIQRQLLPISMTTDPYCKPLFNEFDTVGIIVDLKVNHYDQEVWLADTIGSLLYVRIVDGPKITSLVDNMKIGQTVALCNLVMHLPHNDFGQAVANQFSTISQFPQQKFLQNALELFNNQLNGLTKLINECKHKIETLRAHVNLKPNRSYPDLALLHKTNINISANDESLDENASIPSRLTLTDVAMSLIDTDQFL